MRTRTPSPRPDDFALRYEWNAGSMPPPHHYEYVITVGPGLRGEIVLCPDYPGEGVPAWREALVVTDATLNGLYGMLVEIGALDGHWAPMRDRPIGGEVDWLDITAGGETVRIPALAAGREALEPLYDAMRALVPADVWQRLLAQRQEYVDTYRA